MIKFYSKICLGKEIEKILKTLPKIDPKMEVKSGKMISKNRCEQKKKRFLMQSPVTAEPLFGPGGIYNSTRYPPDRIYPRKKTNRKEIS